MFIGKLNPKTGQVTEYPIPEIKPGYPVGTLDLEIDKDDNLWVAIMYQGAVAKLDRKTGKFETWSTPRNGTPTPASSGISRSRERLPTTRCGSRIPPAATSFVSISHRANSRTSVRPRISAPEAYRHLRHPGRCRGTICICSISPLAISCGSMPRPRSRRYSSRRRRTRPRRGRVDDHGRLGFAEISATPSACSIRKAERSRNGRCDAVVFAL